MVSISGRQPSSSLEMMIFGIIWAILAHQVASDCLTNNEIISDGFKIENETTWDVANDDYVDQFAPCYYLSENALFNQTLTQSEGLGLQMKMEQCPYNDDESACSGSSMVSAHLSTTNLHSFGDYEVRLRAPYNYPQGNESECDDGIYAYFTAGYVNSECGIWNEMNFGFHPDRDNGGTSISCEVQADTGSYLESIVSTGVPNYRDGFHTYRLKLRSCDVSWWIDDNCIHVKDVCLTQPMHTSLILRTNAEGVLPSARMEYNYFTFKPYSGSAQTPKYEKFASMEEKIAWHNSHPQF